MTQKEQYKQLQISLFKTVSNYLETTKDDWVENLIKSKENKETGVLKYKDDKISSPKNDILQIVFAGIFQNRDLTDEREFYKKLIIFLSTGEEKWLLWIFDSIYNYARHLRIGESTKEDYIKYLGYLKEKIDILYKWKKWEGKEDKEFKKKTETFYNMIVERLENPEKFLKFRF